MRYSPLLWALGAFLIVMTGCAHHAENITTVQRDLAGLAIAIDSYEVDNEHLPATLTVLNDQQPFAATYLKANISLIDAWGTPYSYSVVSNRYDLRSAGPDRVLMTDDDKIWKEDNTEQGVSGYRRQSAPQPER